MIKVKLSIPGFGNNLNLSQYVGNKENILGECKFFVNNSEIEDADFWFVLDNLQLPIEKVKVPSSNVFFLGAEIIYPTGHYDSKNNLLFLNQFSKIFSSYDIYSENAYFELPYLGWMINANHGVSIFSDSERDINWLKNLKLVEKTKTISVFCSNKILTNDHAIRYKFVEKLKNYFGEYIDWFGNGVNSLSQKWDGIAPYKYHIALENQSKYNVITEKIYDSYLGLAFPFYWGASNLSAYFPENSFERIEILDWKSAINTIENGISNDLWSKSSDLLFQCKNKVLTDYNPFQRIVDIVNAQKSFQEEKVLTELYSFHEINKKDVDYLKGIKNKLGRILINFGNKLNNEL